MKASARSQVARTSKQLLPPSLGGRERGLRAVRHGCREGLDILTAPRPSREP